MTAAVCSGYLQFSLVEKKPWKFLASQTFSQLAKAFSIGNETFLIKYQSVMNQMAIEKDVGLFWLSHSITHKNKTLFWKIVSPKRWKFCRLILESYGRNLRNGLRIFRFCSYFLVCCRCLKQMTNAVEVCILITSIFQWFCCELAGCKARKNAWKMAMRRYAHATKICAILPKGHRLKPLWLSVWPFYCSFSFHHDDL